MLLEVLLAILLAVLSFFVVVCGIFLVAKTMYCCCRLLLLRGRHIGGGDGEVEDVSGGLVGGVAIERGKALDVVKFCRVVSARGTRSPILWWSSGSCFLWQ